MFMMLFAAVFIIGTTTVLLYEQQIGIVNFVDLSLGKTSAPLMRGTYQETNVKGLFMYYQSCPSTFTGACDDASLYRLAADGTKEVIVSSVRNIPQAPVTSELLQPMEQSVGGQYIVFGAWAYGSDRNPTDRRVWVYDVLSGETVARADVSVNAVFSPDYKYAAYASNDYMDLVIVNLDENQAVSGAKATVDTSFLGPENKSVIVWQDTKNLIIKLYNLADASNSIPSEYGEKRVKVK